MKTMLLLLSLCLSMSAFAGHYYQEFFYPSTIQAQKISLRGSDSVLDICCHYPNQIEANNLKLTGAIKIIIRAQAFPSEEEFQILQDMNISYDLILSEVFPSIADIQRINNANIKELRILSKDFPYLGEVEIFNKFSIPVRFDILKRQLPTEEYMIVIRQFKAQITVAFHNDKVPGPGHAGFFNSMPSHKVFVVHDQFPYGIDATGLSDFNRTKIEIGPSERLMPQDIPVLNQFTHSVKLSLDDIWPMSIELLSLINSISVNEIILKDNGSHDLLQTQIITSLGSAKSNIIFKFNRY